MLRFRERQRSERFQRFRQSLFASQFPPEHQALLLEMARLRIVSLRLRHTPKATGGQSDPAPITEISPDTLTLFIERVRLFILPLLEGQVGQVADGHGGVS